MCEKVVESVFDPIGRLVQLAQVGWKSLLCPPLNFSECFSGSLLVVCLFVCFSQTSKNCWLQPFRTCQRLAAIVTLVAISALTKLAACLLPSLGNFITLDYFGGKIFLLDSSLGCPQDFLFHLSNGGFNWIPRTAFTISTDSRIVGPACQPIPWISWHGRLAHDSVDPLIGSIGVLWD